MKLLLLIGLLALSEARGVRDDSTLQHLSERQPDKGQSQEQNPIFAAIKATFEILDAKIDALYNRVGRVEDQVEAILAQAAAGQGEHDGGEAEGGEGEGGQSGSGEPVNPEEPVNPPGHEAHLPPEESEANQEGEGEEPSGSGSGESSNPEQTAMRIFVQKIKSRLDEIKREQTRMKLSETLRHMIPENRRK